MQQFDQPHPLYGDDVHYFLGVPCVAQTMVPIALVEHLVDTGMSDAGMLQRFSTAPLPAVVRVENTRLADA